PAVSGLEAQKQAIEYGVKFSGCTVHFVDEHLDHGPIILQKIVPVLEDDDDHSLSARILEQEHLAYSEAIGLVLSGEIEVRDRRVVRRKSGEMRRVKRLNPAAKPPTVAHPAADLRYDNDAAESVVVH